VGGFKMNNLNEKLADAKKSEIVMKRPVYVAWSAFQNCYLTTCDMPLMGEWYTSDGIQHGPKEEKK
jgi:hypothetical protein